MRKERPEKTLGSRQLDEKVHHQLVEKLLTHTYPEALEWLHQNFGIETSATALANFYQQHCAPLVLRRAARAADGFAEEAGGLGANWAAPSKAMIKQRHFELLASPRTDPKELALYAQMISSVERAELERERLEFDQRKHAETNALRRQDLALQREKFEFDAVKLAIEHAQTIKTISTDRSLNADEKALRMRQLLFPQAFKSEGAE